MNEEISKRLEREFLKRREEIRQRFQHLSDTELEAEKARGDLEGDVASDILIDRRRELNRSARIIAWATIATAVATIAAALAAWMAIYFQYWHKTPNEARQLPVSISATPSPR